MKPNATKVFAWAISDRAKHHAQSLSDQYDLLPSMRRKLPGACIGALPVQTDDNGFFDVDCNGWWALVVATEITLNGDVLDLVSFHPTSPRKVYRCTGRSSWLGEHAVRRRSYPAGSGYVGPICVSDTLTRADLNVTWNALEFIRSSGDKCLPLDRAAYLDLFDLLPGVRVICDERKGGNEIDSYLRRPPAEMPEVFFIRGGVRKAA